MKRLASLLALSLLGCASTSPDRGFRDISAVVAERTGHPLYWNRDTPEDAQVAKIVHDVLQHPLTVEQAIQIALLNNRNLTATYEELSISQAEVVQAGLLKNPSFRAGMTTAEADRLDPNLTLGLTWDFLDVLMLPAKKKIAAAQFEASKRRVADAVLDLAAQVKRAYYDLQGAQQIATMRGIVADAAEASIEIASAQNDAGNLNDLDLANQRGAQQQLALDLARAQADVVTAREHLTSLLGLWGAGAGFQVSDRLMDIPGSEPPLVHLESLAVAQRLDLDAMRKEREALGRTLSLVRSTRYTPGLGVGIEGARLRDGRIALAPSAEIELPIFDQKQALVARIDAMFRQSDERLRARAVEVRSEVRAARDRMIFARNTVTLYRSQVIPVRERVVALSQEQFDAMLLGVYQLLAAKQSEVTAYREYIEATRDYWLARTDLERAVGGKLAAPAASASPPRPTLPSSTPAAPSDSAPMPMQHHHS